MSNDHFSSIFLQMQKCSVAPLPSSFAALLLYGGSCKGCPIRHCTNLQCITHPAASWSVISGEFVRHPAARQTPAWHRRSQLCGRIRWCRDFTSTSVRRTEIRRRFFFEKGERIAVWSGTCGGRDGEEASWSGTSRCKRLPHKRGPVHQMDRSKFTENQPSVS